jgi:hypothetical protein
MTSRRPAPDDRQLGNGPPPAPGGADQAGGPLGAQRMRLAAFWALVLRRFRGYAQGAGAAAGGDEQGEEGT